MGDNKFKIKLITVALTTLSGTAMAQDRPPAGRAAVLEEVVVTAQRRAESIQDVPMTLTAITGKNIDEYQIFEFEGLQQLSPGLSLVNNGAFGSVAQVRGVGYDTNSSASPAVDIYINDTPVDANYAFQSLYDIGQVEVLRGPQGILRGRPSPAGAITVTTRRPELDAWGGTLSASGSDQDATNFQGGVNVPVIQDRLALRLAGVVDENELDKVSSVNSNNDSKNDTESWRASLRWAPTDAIDGTLTHQWLRTDIDPLFQVEGPGAGYNGRPINGPGHAVEETKPSQTLKMELTTLNLSWDLDHHRIVFGGAYQDNTFDTYAELDDLNAVTHYAEPQYVKSSFKVTTYELRLESTDPDQFVEYLVGLWYQKNDIGNKVQQESPLDGAFGSPAAPNPIGPPNSAYIIPVDIDIPIDQKNKAIYGNLVFHLTDKADLSLGARYLEDKSDRVENIDTGSALLAFDIASQIGLQPGTPVNFCGAPGVLPMPPFTGTETYPGYCDLRLDASSFSQPASEKKEHWVYNASLQYNFTDDMMVYFTFAHSWRPPGVTVGITSPVTPSKLISGDPEESESYELGLRSEWMDSRLRFNASVYHQDYNNYVGRFNDLPYVGAGDTLQTAGFTYPADAVVDGFEMDLTWDVTDNWWVQLTTAYADGHYDDAEVPCRDTNGDGQPDNGDIGNLTPGDFGDNSVLFCKVDYALSPIPKSVTTLQSSYSFPVFDQQGYARVLYNYYGDQSDYGLGYEADAYGVMNLYLGVTSESGAWDLSLWAKNALDDDTRLYKGEPQTKYGVFPTGYYSVRYVPEREVGITLRYIFGEG
ncbi:MAG: TonB-dependent receptor [Pseudomonadales bacterium]|nr:TonB-dependent receptor [Pseudomonadales bacterium]MCP5190267.1 TonB-dependent receptor [Pseudomonadales bacterium]